MKSCKLKLATTLLAFFTGVAAFFVWDGIKLFPNFVQTKLVGKSHSKDVSLQISSEKTSVRVGEELSLKVALTNNDSETVTLVNPGDGSENHWRTPFVHWSIVKATDVTQQHPAEPVKSDEPRCGNMNRLKAEEIFGLSSGETRELSWTYLPPFREPGVYKVVFLYANRPSLKWRFESEIAYHDSIALWRAKHSTETNVASNELVFTVTE